MKRRFTVDVLAPDYQSKIGTFAPENLLSASCSWNWWSVSTGTVYVREEGPEAAQLLLNNVIPVPVTMKATGYPRWDGYVVYSSLTKDAGKAGRITATMVSNRKWIDRVLAAPVPNSPWSNQASSEYDKRTGPLATVVRQYMLANISRISSSGVELPLQVTPAPVNDTSPVITIEARNESIRDEIETTIEANGYDVVSYLWLPGDEQPPGMLLTKSSVVLDVVKGREKNYVNFTDESGGIAQRTISVSAPSATAVVIGGAGEGTARVFNYVRALTPTPERTKAAQIILDRMRLVVPPMTRAAVLIRDRINSGSDYFEDWTWKDAPVLAGAYNDQLLDLYPGNVFDRPSAVNWLNNYVNTNGGDPTLPVPDKNKAAQAILSRFSNEQPVFANWTWVGAPSEVVEYADDLASFYRGNTQNVAASIAWLTGYIATYDGQEFFADWSWYEAPILVGRYRRELIALYGGDPRNWPAARAWLQTFINANSGAGAELYPGMYSETFFEATGDLDTETRIVKGRERLAELGGKVAMSITIDDERPWQAGPDKDYWVGDYVRATFSNITTADYITRVTVTSNSEGFQVSAQLGDANMTETSDLRLANVVRQLAQEVSSLKAKR